MGGQEGGGGDPIARTIENLSFWLGLGNSTFLMLEFYPRYKHVVVNFLRQRLDNDWFWFAELSAPWIIGIVLLLMSQLAIYTFINGVRLRVMIGG